MVEAWGNASNAGLTEERAVERVEIAQRAGHIPTFLRDFGLSMCRRDHKLFDDFVSKIKGASYRMNQTDLHLSRRPPSERHSQVSDTEQEIARRLGVSVEDMARIKV